MKKMKKLLSIIAVLLMVFCMTIPVSAAGKINKSKIILLTGQTIQLKVSETSGGTTWISSKKSVATVNKSGKVLAKKKGSAIITAKAGNKKYTCKVTVETPKLNKKNVTLKVGESITLKVTGTKQPVKWKSSRKNVVTVKNGTITAKKAGTANVTAMVLGKKFTCKVSVRKTPTSNNVRPEIPTAGSGVWIPNSGSKYHRYSSCSNMRNPRNVSENQAISMGYTPCKKCY